DDLARLVVAPVSEQPFLATPILARGARVALVDDADGFLAHVRGGEFGRSALLGSLDAALPRDATASCRPTESPSRVAAILVRRGAAGVDVTLRLVAAGLAELIVLDPRAESSPSTVVVAFPSPFAGGMRAGVAIVETGRTPRDAAAHAAAVSRCRE